MHYSAFGLNIESQFPLPSIMPRGHCKRMPTVWIQEARPTQNWAGLLNDADAGDCFAAALKTGRMRYAVRDGECIMFWPSSNIPREESFFMMQTMATGFAFSILLRQRGFLTLHASILQKYDKTIGFVGDSGCGKSTLAEYFSQQGYSVLSDDIGAIRVSSNCIEVLAGFPIVKLRRSSASMLRKETRDFYNEMMDGRRHVAKPSVEPSPVELDRLYLLEDTFSSFSDLVTISVQKLVFELARNTHGCKHLIRDDYQARLLQQCAAVAERVPTQVLHRKEGLDHLASTLAIIEDDLRVAETMANHPEN